MGCVLLSNLVTLFYILDLYFISWPIWPGMITHEHVIRGISKRIREPLGYLVKFSLKSANLMTSQHIPIISLLECILLEK